jgi:hypothetical protein
VELLWQMITDDDDDDVVEFSLAAYRAGKLTDAKVADRVRAACEDYRLDAVCCSCFMDAPAETRIAVLASLTSVPPGVRQNDDAFVKNSFANIARARASASAKESAAAAAAAAALAASASSSVAAADLHSSSPHHQGVDLDADSTDDADDSSAAAIAAIERAQFPQEFIDKLIAVLRYVGADGVLGSQFPDVYRRIHGEKLVLENRKGRKLKLLHVLDGHPNVRKEKLGTYKWFYKDATDGAAAAVPAPTPGPASSGAAGKGKAAAEAKEARAAKTARGNQREAKDKGAAAKTASPAPAPAITTAGAAPGPASALSPGSAAAATYTGPAGVEADLLPADYFPTVAWLRAHDMHMYRWAGNAVEWTEFAMRLTPLVAAVMDEPLLANLRTRSGCAVSVAVDTLYGVQEKFLVFVRGDSGKPSNGNMAVALELWSQMLQTDLRDVLVGGAVAPPAPPAAPAAPAAPVGAAGDVDGGDPEDYDADAAAASGMHGGDGRIQRVLELPHAAVALIAGKAGKKLYAMRKKSGAYVALVSKSKAKGSTASLTISGSVAAVELALNLVKQALAEYTATGHDT